MQSPVTLREPGIVRAARSKRIMLQSMLQAPGLAAE
jgi:hypothetical protein